MMNDSRPWKAEWKFEAKTFDYLKHAIAEWARQASESDDFFKNMPQWQVAGVAWAASASYRCATETRIAQLRAEADRLEAELFGYPHE